ncbi:MAG: DNA-3-methyladenine glycosylase 2 family protein [Aquihabitans sp.]
MLQRTLPLPYPVDLAGTLAGVQRGTHDLSCTIRDNEVWRASRAPGGPATVHLVAHGSTIEAEAWGEGAEAALDAVPALVGLDDAVDDFQPDHPVIARLWRDHPGLRIPRSQAVYESLLAVVLEQRVTIFEARRAHSQLLRTWGEPAPGPGDLLLPPDPEVLSGVAYYDLHVLGVEKKRADTIRRVAATARHLDALAQLPAAAAAERLTHVVGIGPWTAAEVGLTALGDADAVPVGDVHFPSDVTYVLTGTAVDDDEAMLDALEPFTGHRGRVIRLIQAAGLHAPRRGPRYAPRPIAEH